MAKKLTPSRRITRGNDRALLGVASGLAHHLGIPPWTVRLGFIVLTFLGVIGIPLYVIAALLMPEPEAPWMSVELPATRQPPRGRLSAKSLQQVAAVSLILVGSLLLLRNVGWLWSEAVVWPITLGGIGLAVLWARTDEDERARFTQAANRLPGRPLEALTSGHQALLRLIVGGVLLTAGIGVFLAANDAFEATRQVILAVAVTAAGLGLMLGPWIRRLVTELRTERQERIRSEERADMAAHLHDSVLQTLALIQRNADRPRELMALARRQERELRSWLYPSSAVALGRPGTLAATVQAMADVMEDLHGIEVDVVVVGDCAVDDGVDALVQAAREAVVNAAKHSGAAEVSVYVEAEADKVSAFVRDRGRGFERASVPADRHGIAQSIADRMSRRGGTATVSSIVGEGTEVSLELPR